MKVDGKAAIDWSPTLVESSRRCADLLVETAAAAIRARGCFSFVLAGGSTPKCLYELLAEKPWRSAVDWSRVYVFWGDERCVPAQHPDSNFRLAAESFLDDLPIPKEQIFPMPAELLPEAGAREYEKVLLRLFSHQGVNCIPIFDLVLLGMGEDGHTASLFPGDAALKEQRRLVTAVAPPLGVCPALPRLTLTLPLINKARNVWFLVSGTAKEKVAAAVITSAPGAEKLPAALITPQGLCRWFLSDCRRDLFPGLGDVSG